MMNNKKQVMIYALITVIITVCAFVFYSLYIINGDTLMSINNTSSVIYAIKLQGGIYMFGKMASLPVVIIVEFILAYSLELLIGGPGSFKLANKLLNKKNVEPFIFELAIICSTVLIMCPIMSFLASILYYPYYSGFNIIILLTNFIKLVIYNFPFAFFSQIFFIQPLVRTIFKKIFNH